jgi:hypothetical protein
MGDLTGMVIERWYRDKAPGYLLRIMRRPHVLSSDELVETVEDAVECGKISMAERDDAIVADVVVHGWSRDDGSAMFVVVEVAPEIGSRDVKQAVREAGVWTKLGAQAQPVVAGLAISAEAEKLAQEKQVLVHLFPDPFEKYKKAFR